MATMDKSESSDTGLAEPTGRCKSGRLFSLMWTVQLALFIPCLSVCLRLRVELHRPVFFLPEWATLCYMHHRMLHAPYHVASTKGTQHWPMHTQELQNTFALCTGDDNGATSIRLLQLRKPYRSCSVQSFNAHEHHQTCSGPSRGVLMVILGTITCMTHTYTHTHTHTHIHTREQTTVCVFTLEICNV